MKCEIEKIRVLSPSGVGGGRRCLLALVTVLLFFKVAVAEDWPTYMHDNARSGVSSEPLVLDDLEKGWVYTSPVPPRVAWDGGAPWDSYRSSSSSNVCELTPQRDFDFVFFVTVVGDFLYFGSSVTDSVHCLEIRTGEQKWFFTANGPVRYPPSYYEDKLYFTSDDGHAYCITAQDGSLVWKYSPSEDDRLIGNNGSLISMWPARTGTAVLDGKVYFAASLVNWQVSYLCSVDAQTGSVAGAGLYRVSGGITPMGAILASATKLYVLQGRSYPYVFNRADGSSRGTFGEQGQSGCYALLTSDSRFVRGHAKVQAEGYELAEYNPDTRDHLATHPEGRRLVVGGTSAYLLKTDSLSAIRRSDGRTMWSVPSDCPHALILVGDILFAGGTNKVAAYSAANGDELWSRAVHGRARGIASADGRLYVSTDTGSIHMFGRTHLPADLNRDGVVNLLDLAAFADDYLECTDPTNTQWPCDNLSTP